MKTLHIIALILVIIGGLNWLLIGLADFDLVAAIFGPMTAMSRFIYVLVGLAAIVELVLLIEGLAHNHAIGYHGQAGYHDTTHRPSTGHT